MTNVNASITIIGAGSYGTALAIVLAKNGHNVVLWDHDSRHIKVLKINRYNKIFLPNIPFPNSLYLEISLSKALSSSRDILLVVPSYVFGKMLKQIKPLIRQDTRIVWATKGLEAETGRLLQEVACEILGNDIPLAIISGPTFAKELAEGLPTEISLASNDQTFSKDLQKLFYCCKSLRVYKNLDFIGIQIGGAVKNVIAISTGMSDGIGFGANSRIMLITRGLTEMSYLGKALGANPETLMGMTGLGDLILTCTDNQSRNRRFGMMIGQGMDIKSAKITIGQVIEGFYNTKEVRELAHRFDVEMPIVEEVYNILYRKKKVKHGIQSLLEYSYK